MLVKFSNVFHFELSSFKINSQVHIQHLAPTRLIILGLIWGLSGCTGCLVTVRLLVPPLLALFPFPLEPAILICSVVLVTSSWTSPPGPPQGTG